MRAWKCPSAAMLAAIIALSCDGGGPPPDPLADYKREVLASITEHAIVGSIHEFGIAASAMSTAVSAYAADPSDPNRSAAQDAWREAMEAWELVEVMQIGPTGLGGTLGVVGGEGIRDEIYTYEARNTCLLDQETVDQIYLDVEAYAAELVNVRGLDALEYLLFVESAENTCAAGGRINTEGSWAALDATEIAARRAGLAATVATLISREAARLEAAWSITDGFGATLSQAGLTGNPFVSAQAGLNEIAGGMLYLDTDTQDKKLGPPAGIAGCAVASCPDALEAPHARVDATLLAANMRAFQRLYLGDVPGRDALGWDDLLVEVGEAQLAADLGAAIDAAIAALDALGPSLADAIANDMPAVMAAYDAITEALRLFEVDVFTVLDVEPSGPRIGDND